MTLVVEVKEGGVRGAAVKDVIPRCTVYVSIVAEQIKTSCLTGPRVRPITDGAKLILLGTCVNCGLNPVPLTSLLVIINHIQPSLASLALVNSSDLEWMSSRIGLMSGLHPWRVCVCASYVDGPGSQGIGVGGSLQCVKYLKIDVK